MGLVCFEVGRVQIGPTDWSEEGDRYRKSPDSGLHKAKLDARKDSWLMFSEYRLERPSTLPYCPRCTGNSGPEDEKYTVIRTILKWTVI